MAPAGRVEAVEDKTSAENVEVEALGINLKKLAREVIELMPELPAAATELVESITHPGHLADLIAANVDVPIEEKQAVLETVDHGQEKWAIRTGRFELRLLRFSGSVPR